MKSIHVLLAEGHEDLRNTMSSILEMDGFRVSAAGNFEAAADFLSHRRTASPPVDILIADVGLGSFGLRLVELARKLSPEPLVMALTGLGTKETVVGMLRRGISEYLEKPFHMNEFRARAATLRDQIQSLGNGFSGLAWGAPDAEAAYHVFRENRKSGSSVDGVSGFSGSLPADCALTGRFKRLEPSGEEREMAAACVTPFGCDVLVAEVEGRDLESFHRLMLIRSFFEHHRRHPMDPVSFLRFLNRLLLDDTVDRRMVKAVFVRMIRKEGRMEISNSGGLPAFHLRKVSEFCRGVDIPGSALGLDREFRIHSESVALAGGDRFYFATEGLCAASRMLPGKGGRNRLGHDGLEGLILAHRNQPLEESVDAIWRDALACVEPDSNAGAFLWGMEIP